MISTHVNNVLCPKPYVIDRHSLRGLHPLPPVPVNFVRCPPIKFRAPLKIATDVLKCKRVMPVCASWGEARVGSGNQYMYIIRGAEMTRLAKDYFKYMFGGKKSVRLARVLYVWERFCKRLTNWAGKKVVDPYWLERAIIRTPTWWDSPEKYKRIIKACMEVPSCSSSTHDEDDDDSMSSAHYSMSDEFQEWR